MKKRKLAGLFLCFALALGVALPITMAIPTYADGSSAEKDEMVVIATGSVPSESENSGESGKGSGSSDNSGNFENVETATAPNVATAPNATKPTSGGVVHIDTCLEGCTGEDCACPCHKKSLFERIMACTTIDEIFAIVDETPIEELEEMTEEENSAICEYIESLMPEPLPAVVLDESAPPVESEIIAQEAVSFTNVAPFGDPVIGSDE